ncbi:MAG: organomercurial lyase [Candidatus Kariarchaeaceae archaeon]|jgi:hypothetical protein
MCNPDLLNLHLQVLIELLQKKPFDAIKLDHKEAIEELNYLKEMTAQRNLSFDQNGKLIAAYPLSLKPTQHKITVRGIGNGYAMCAIDALGVAFTLERETQIESQTVDTNKPIKITVDPNNKENLVNELDFFVSYRTMSGVNRPELQQCPMINFYECKKPIIQSGMKILSFNEALQYAKRAFSPQNLLNLHSLDS